MAKISTKNTFNPYLDVGASHLKVNLFSSIFVYLVLKCGKVLIDHLSICHITNEIIICSPSGARVRGVVVGGKS